MKDIGEQLHALLAKELVRRIKDGEATATDLNVARQFLKDNGIDSTVGETTNNPLANLIENLPFDETDEAVQ